MSCNGDHPYCTATAVARCWADRRDDKPALHMAWGETPLLNRTELLTSLVHEAWHDLRQTYFGLGRYKQRARLPLIAARYAAAVALGAQPDEQFETRLRAVAVAAELGLEVL